MGHSLRALLLGPLFLALAACGGAGVEGKGGGGAPAAAEAGPTYGDTFIEASIGDVSGFIPHIQSDSASFDIASLLYSGLVKRDRDLNLVGDLAEGWDFSTDCRTLTFRLRKNVRWHDGHPFTAEDVLFTYRTMVSPKTPTAYAEDFKIVEKAEAPDPFTFRVTYKEPFAPALSSWGIWMLPKHLLEPYVRDGKLREAPQNLHPVGNGPYRFREWKPGEKVVLVANRDYYDRGPYLSRVVYRIIPDQATIFLELKARNIDYAGLTPIQYVRQIDYPAFEKAYQKYKFLASGFTYLGFNLLDPRFADRRVRQGIAYAIDRQELIEGVLLGLGQEATGPYKPGTWVYNPDVRRYPHDPAKARALLAEAGWRDTDGDGWLDKDGRRFTFTILTNQGNETRKKIAEILQQRLKQVGIQVEIRVVEWAAFLKEFVRKRRFEAIILGWGIGEDPDQYDIWHSSKTGPDELNHISYKNPEVDRLLERGRTTCDREARKRIYFRLQEIMAEDLPVIFLYFGEALPVVAARVHGVEPAPAGITYNFTEWYVPQGLQRYTSY